MIPAGKLKRRDPVWIYDGLAFVTRVTPGKDELKHLVVISFTRHPKRGDFTTVLNRREDLPQEKPREIRKVAVKHPAPTGSIKIPLKKAAAQPTIESRGPTRPKIPFKR